MATNIKKVKSSGGGPKQAPLEAGTYPVRVVQIIDLGLQAQREFKGNKKPPRNEINITYEFSDEFMKDDKGEDMPDKPRWLSETIPLHNAAADKAKSTQRYNTLDPKGEDDGEFLKQVGKPTMLTVTKDVDDKDKTKVYNNVASISPPRAKDLDKFPPLVNEGKVFSLDDPDLEVFNSLPEFLQTKIKGNLEFNGSKLQKLLGIKPTAEPESGEEEEEEDVEVEGEVTTW